MNKKEESSRVKNSRPQKFLLHMVRLGDDWAGKATSFSGPTEFHFSSLRELFGWLKKKAGKD